MVISERPVFDRVAASHPTPDCRASLPQMARKDGFHGLMSPLRLDDAFVVSLG